jgi:hypothetical protein
VPCGTGKASSSTANESCRCGGPDEEFDRSVASKVREGANPAIGNPGTHT